MPRFERFDNLLGRGDRTASIGVTTTATLASGTINNVVDGLYASTSSDAAQFNSGQSGREIIFDLGLGVSKKITWYCWFKGSTTFGTWKLQASNDASTWLDITAGESTAGTHIIGISTGTNDGFYRYYKLLQTAGTTVNTARALEIEFAILDVSSGDYKALIAPSYSNFHGMGNRSGYMTGAGDVVFSVGNVADLVDGSMSASARFSAGQSGKYLEFIFPCDCLITEVTWYQNASNSHGTWKWQYVDDLGTPHDVGSSFTLGGSTTQVITAMSGATDYASKFRLQQVSGTTSSGPYILEVDFKVGYPAIAGAAVLTSVTPGDGAIAGGTAVTLTGSGFTGATDVTFDGISATSVVVVSDTSITCVTPAHAAGLVDVVVVVAPSDLTLTDGFEYTVSLVEDWVSQLPLLVMDIGSREIHVEQLPLLVTSLTYEGTQVTQLPVLPLWTETPVPLPSPLVPEVPVTEIWEYLTVVTISENGKEQRSRLRQEPRTILDFGVIMLDDFDRLRVYQMMSKYISQSFDYPNYVYSTNLTADALIGDTRLYFDMSLTDVRDGEILALFDPHIETTLYVTILTSNSDGVNLTEPLTFDVPKYWYVCPAFKFNTTPVLTLMMNAIDGGANFRLKSVSGRTLVRPSSEPSVQFIDGIPLLDKVQLFGADENFDQNIEWIDNRIAPPVLYTNWLFPAVGGSRTYLAHRPTGIDYWREFADAVKGRQRPFLLPTFRNDLPLVEVPALSATVLYSSNVQFFNFWRSYAYQYIQIVTQNGTIYRRILEVLAEYNADGVPYRVSVKLATALGNTAGDNVIGRVSFCNLCRLDSDSIELIHEEIDTKITIVIRTISELEVSDYSNPAGRLTEDGQERLTENGYERDIE